MYVIQVKGKVNEGTSDVTMQSLKIHKQEKEETFVRSSFFYLFQG